MPRSKETTIGLRNLLGHLLTCAPLKSNLLGKAREAVPGVPNAARAAQHRKNPEDVLLTSQQRDWLVNLLAREYWGQLSEDQRQRYIAGEPVPDCPFLEGETTSGPKTMFFLGLGGAEESRRPAAHVLYIYTYIYTYIIKIYIYLYIYLSLLLA